MEGPFVFGGTFGVLSEGTSPKEKDPAPAILLSLTKNERGPFVSRSREKILLGEKL